MKKNIISAIAIVVGVAVLAVFVAAIDYVSQGFIRLITTF